MIGRCQKAGRSPAGLAGSAAAVNATQTHRRLVELRIASPGMIAPVHGSVRQYHNDRHQAQSETADPILQGKDQRIVMHAAAMGNKPNVAEPIEQNGQPAR